MALAASAGLVLDPWQADVLDVALGEREYGKWAAREVGLVVPRQNGKGAVLEALLVASLLVFEEKLILYSAHEFKTAQETYLRVKSLIQASDALMDRGPKFYNAHGSEGVEFRDGQRLRFVARTKGSGRGFSPQRVILDEALNLSTRAVSALLFAMSAQENPQIWYTSSHPEDTPEGEVLRNLMRRGREGDSSLAYVEFCATEDDEDAVAVANPGYPHRIGPEQVATERAATAPEDFRRERLGIIDLSTEVFKVVDVDSWKACKNLQPEIDLRRVRHAIDVSPDARTASIASSDGAHVEIQAHDSGTGWVVAKCKAGGANEVTLDPAGPANELIGPLEAAGITVHQVSTRDAAGACAQFLTGVTESKLTHLGQPELDAAVANADRRDVGDGGWMWSRLRSTVDISPLYAATLARWAANGVVLATPGFVSLDDFLEED